MNTIIHISGFPGSGKTTLGDNIQKTFGNKVVVYDTDNFIQPNTKEGGQLLKLEKEISEGNQTWKEHRILWKNTIKNKIDEFIYKHPNKIIVFVGSLDNFAPPNTIYKINANYKYVLDMPLDELMKRYYLRIYLTEQKVSKKISQDYWKKLSQNTYHIMGSEEIKKQHTKYNLWHTQNNYEFLNDKKIINNIKKIVK